MLFFFSSIFLLVAFESEWEHCWKRDDGWYNRLCVPLSHLGIFFSDLFFRSGRKKKGKNDWNLLEVFTFDWWLGTGWQKCVLWSVRSRQWINAPFLFTSLITFSINAARFADSIVPRKLDTFVPISERNCFLAVVCQSSLLFDARSSNIPFIHLCSMSISSSLHRQISSLFVCYYRAIVSKKLHFIRIMANDFVGCFFSTESFCAFSLILNPQRYRIV